MSIKGVKLKSESFFSISPGVLELWRKNLRGADSASPPPLIGMKPIDAIKQTLVKQGFSQPVKEYEEKLLDVGTKVRYLYESGELEGQIYKGERRK